MSRILLVEDSEECQLVVRRALANADIQLYSVPSFEEAKQVVAKEGVNFDLVILDLMLPDGDGFSVLDFLRGRGLGYETPVFFLTSESEIDSKLIAFNLGADDYLVKPVSPVEIRARIEMRLKKSKTLISDSISKGELTIEMSVLKASKIVDNKAVDLGLTAKEFKILAFLVQHEGTVYSRAQLVAAVWGNDIHILDRTVDSHVYGLRKKMGSISHYIECIPNAGYRFRINLPATATG